MNKFYLFLFLLFQFLLVNAQELCKTPTEMNRTTKELLANSNKTRSNLNYLIKVYFHVIRKNNGTGASVVQNNVQTAFNTLNTDFNPHGIYFRWDTPIDYIDNTTYYNTPSTSIFSVNNHSDGVDIYLYGDNVCEGGLANGIANSTEYYIGGYHSSFPLLYLSGTHVVSHEMGHVLGLYHTHHGTYYGETSSSSCAELVNGSNSDVCGDLIEDTPADPFLGFNVNPITGQWLGSGAIDANGDPYQPDTHLIMSYTHPLCMSYFSTQQGEKMRYAISHVPALQNATISAGRIVGPELVYSYNMFYVENLPSYVDVIWSVDDSYYDSNLLTDFPDPGQCVLFRATSHDMMNGTLTADIYYNNVLIQTLTKTVSAYDDFWGQYTSGDLSGTINYTHYFNVRQGCTTRVNSPNFYGAMSVTYDNSATIPSFWWFNSTDGFLEFSAPVNNNGSSMIIINVTDKFLHNYQLYASASGIYYLNISPGENIITVTLNEDGNSERGIDIDPSWTIEVRNATTGALMATRSSTSRSETISTAGWPKGIYIVKVTVGKEVLTEKVIVK